MGMFRFMSPDHAKATVDKGVIRCGSLDYFRLLEAFEGPDIGDRREAQAVNSLPDIRVDGANPIPADWQFPSGLMPVHPIEPGSNSWIQLNDVKYVDERCGFVLSFSEGDLADLVPKRCKKAAYSGALEALDLHQLADVLQRHARVIRRVRDRDVDCGAVRELFEVDSGPVRYENTEQKISSSAPLVASPFRKADLLVFREQREHRIALMAEKSWSDDHVYLHLAGDKLRDLLVVRDLREWLPADLTSDNSEEEEAEDVHLAQLFGVWRAIEERTSPPTPIYDLKLPQPDWEAIWAAYVQNDRIARDAFENQFDRTLRPVVAKHYSSLRSRREELRCQELDRDLRRFEGFGRIGFLLGHYLSRVDYAPYEDYRREKLEREWNQRQVSSRGTCI